MQKTIDAKAMYEAAIFLAEAGKSVSPESVLAELDSDGPTRKIQPQAESKEDRQRRAKLLSAASGTALESHVQRILARQRERLVESRSWAAVTLAMFNVGGVLRHVYFRPRDPTDRPPADICAWRSSLQASRPRWRFCSCRGRATCSGWFR